VFLADRFLKLLKALLFARRQRWKKPPQTRGLLFFLVQFVCQNAVPNSSAGPQGGIW